MLDSEGPDEILVYHDSTTNDLQLTKEANMF